MIDTHCHLTYPQLHDQLSAVLDRAAAAGVRRMISIGTSCGDSLAARELARRFDQLSCAAGIHPHHAMEASEQDLEQVVSLFSDPLVCAAGEMGLDYHYDFAPRDAQLGVFERQLEGARRAGKPVVIHSRESVDDSLGMLGEAGITRGVFHCFTGTMSEARRILDAGFHLGFTGIITFSRSSDLREIVTTVPADRLLLETDAPYLAPEPMRKQRVNEPSYIVHTFQLAAKIRGVRFEQLVEQTSRNARDLFGLSE